MTIQEKCHQYWNETNITDEEIHSILEWIHNRTDEADKKIERLRKALKNIKETMPQSPRLPIVNEIKEIVDEALKEI